MELDVELQQSDYAAQQAAIRQSAGLSFGWRDLVGAIAAGVLLVVVKRAFRFDFDYLSAGLTVAFFAAAWLLFLLRARPRLVPDESSVLLGTHRYLLDDSGFRITTPNYEAVYNWSAINSLQETRDLILVKLDRVAAIIVPKRAFSDNAQQKAFLEELRRRAA